MKAPTSIKEAQALLGLANYYRRFVEDFAGVVHPIQKSITIKPYVWTLDCVEALSRLRANLTADSCLSLPDFNKRFLVDTDACDSGIGAVLSQEFEDSSSKLVEKPIEFFSKHHNAQQLKYSTTEKELMAIVLAVEHWKFFLFGKPFVVRTDHQPLKWLLTSNVQSPRVTRWRIRLEMFDFEVIYRRGQHNANADCLSRLTIPPDTEDSYEPEEFIVCVICVTDESAEIFNMMATVAHSIKLKMRH